MLRRLRPAAYLLAIVAFNLLLLLVLTEISLRILAACWKTPLLTPPDPNSEELIECWRGRPHGTFHGRKLNSLGFFDTEFSVERRPAVRRVVALIDSFGVGVVPYEDNFLTLVDDQLDADGEVEVYNFGIRNMAPIDLLFLYRTEVQQYAPDLVLTFLFIGNDIESREPPGPLDPRSLYTLAVLRRMFLVAARGPDIRLTDDTVASFTRGEFLEIEYARLQYAVRDMRHYRRVREGFRDTFAVLEQMHDLVGDRLRIVLIPDEYQVSDELFRTVAGRERHLYDSRIPNRRLVKFLKERGIPYLDLLDVFRAANRHKRTYKPYDTHWNRHGNHVAAAALTEWLRAELEAVASTPGEAPR